MDSLTSVSLKISEKRAKKEHASKGTTDFLGYQSKDSLEYNYTDRDTPGQAFEGETLLPKQNRSVEGGGRRGRRGRNQPGGESTALNLPYAMPTNDHISSLLSSQCCPVEATLQK